MEGTTTVLVADPSEDCRASLAGALNREPGLELVGTAGDGNEALAIVDEKRPDILILDLVLPGLDGLGVIRALSNRPYAPTIIVVSSFTNELAVAEASALGVSSFLPKPCDEAQLIRCIDRSTRRGAASAFPAWEWESTVTEVLHEIGIPAHIKGYQYLRESIIVAMYDFNVMNAVTKRLYPLVAKRYATTAPRVERAMRHAIEVACDRGDAKVLQKYFGYTISDARGKPTNSEFVAMIADCLRIRLRRSSM